MRRVDQKLSSIPAQLEIKLNVLLAMTPITNGRLPPGIPNCGVYLFTEFDKHLYVGRSNDFRNCYAHHCLPGAWHRHASFARCLARDWLGIKDLGYRAVGRTDNTPILDSTSAKAFTAAKARIRTMDFRFVEEIDARRQALLEMYCAVVLDIPYGDFDSRVSHD
jgi:hypothetical protein